MCAHHIRFARRNWPDSLNRVAVRKERQSGTAGCALRRAKYKWSWLVFESMLCAGIKAKTQSTGMRRERRALVVAAGGEFIPEQSVLSWSRQFVIKSVLFLRYNGATLLQKREICVSQRKFPVKRMSNTEVHTFKQSIDVTKYCVWKNVRCASVL